MNNFKSFMEKFKKNMFMYIVVWLAMVILLVAPITYTITNSRLENITWIQGILSNLVNNLLEFPITKVFETTYINDYLTGVKVFSIIYWILIFIAISKTLPKSKYDNIEHGSSDWCENGEQYKVLSKKDGLLLAKDHYLPLTKPGNHNVLIVGRIWCG